MEDRITKYRNILAEFLDQIPQPKTRLSDFGLENWEDDYDIIIFEWWDEVTAHALFTIPNKLMKERISEFNYALVTTKIWKEHGNLFIAWISDEKIHHFEPIGIPEAIRFTLAMTGHLNYYQTTRIDAPHVVI